MPVRIVTDPALVRTKLGLDRYAERAIVAKALGVHDRTALRMNLPGVRIGQKFFVDLKAAGIQLLGEANRRK
jgi:hypothetical protein